MLSSRISALCNYSYSRYIDTSAQFAIKISTIDRRQFRRTLFTGARAAKYATSCGVAVRWRWKSGGSGALEVGKRVENCGKAPPKAKVSIGGRAPGPVPSATRQTHSSRVPEWQMANAPTVSFVRRFWPGILDPWSSLAMTTDGQGQKGQMEIFSNYCRRQQPPRRQTKRSI